MATFGKSEQNAVNNTEARYKTQIKHFMVGWKIENKLKLQLEKAEKRLEAEKKVRKDAEAALKQETERAKGMEKAVNLLTEKFRKCVIDMGGTPSLAEQDDPVSKLQASINQLCVHLNFGDSLKEAYEAISKMQKAIPALEKATCVNTPTEMELQLTPENELTVAAEVENVEPQPSTSRAAMSLHATPGQIVPLPLKMMKKERIDQIRHGIVSTKVEGLYLCFCGHNVETKKQLKNHVQYYRRKDKRSLSCEYLNQDLMPCLQVFHSALELTRHVQQVHNSSKRYRQCGICRGLYDEGHKKHRQEAHEATVDDIHEEEDGQDVEMEMESEEMVE